MAAGPALDTPPETVTPRGKRAMEARPDVNVSMEVGTDWSCVVLVDVEILLEVAGEPVFGSGAWGGAKPHDNGGVSERTIKADFLMIIVSYDVVSCSSGGYIICM